MNEKVTLPVWGKKGVWWFITISLYVVSTIGLMAGLKIGLEEGVAGTTGILISAGLAGWLGFLIGLVIQGWETMMVLDWDESDRAEKTIGIVMLVVDALALFLALGGHLNVIWMSKHFGDTPGMITHVLGLSTQILAAMLVSIGAELALRRTLKVMGVQPVTKSVQAPFRGFDLSGLLRPVTRLFSRFMPRPKPSSPEQVEQPIPWDPAIFAKLPKR